MVARRFATAPASNWSNILFMTERRTKFTNAEAIDVWLRHWSGQTGDSIAYDYRINAGRVSDVLNRKTHLGSRESALRIWKQRSIA